MQSYALWLQTVLCGACSGGHMFSGSYDKTVRVWDVDELVCLATLQGHSGAVRALAASPSLVFSGSDDNTINVRAPPPSRRCRGQ